MNITKQAIILSAERSNLDKTENEKRHIMLKNCLNDCNLPFKEAVGVFNNGPEEKSVVVVVNNDAEVQAVQDFAFKTFDQDAVLYQDANQEGYVITKNGETTRLGRLTQVSKEVALEKGSFTLMDDIYYTTVPRT